MKSTSKKILDAARFLFNSRGIEGTGLRQIAEHSKISPGNLTYHFSNKQLLVEALYFELVEQMDRLVESYAQAQGLLPRLYQATKTSMELFFDYRFLLRDMHVIFRESSLIRQHYIALQAQRKTQFSAIFEAMIEEGFLRPAYFEGEYANLYERMQILGDGWILASDLFEESHAEPVEYYHQLLFETLFPYFTEKGRVVYHTLD